ncbi:MAG: restriction endonuclease [Ruminococcus sp.]|jgi:hypothetical protein|nr:restriction endonuclease [Ruminococcus sp.]
MRFFTRNEINDFLSLHNYDIRISHNGRWIDQKCTADVVTIIADCIVNYVSENGNEPFSSMDIWHNGYTVENVEDIFKKPNPDEKKARNEYDKFFQQPMEMLANACVLNKTKRGNRNFYAIANQEMLEFISLSDRKALTFIQCYIEKVLTDSGIIDLFVNFFNNDIKSNFENMKEAFEDFTIAYTPINGRTECRRIFTKVINPLAFLHGTSGTEGGHLSQHKITYDMLMYNRDNFRDIYANKPKEMTRAEYAETVNIHANSNLTKYMSQRAKRIVRAYNDQFRNGITEVLNDTNHVGDLATHVHHIFPEAEYPEICMYLENLIALTPTQHFNYAHPNGNTQRIDRDYQQICLLAKSDVIREDIEQHDEPIYEFAKFLFVCCVGLCNESFNEIEDEDYDGVVTAINLAYIA